MSLIEAGDLVITSPNMTFITKPFIFEKAELQPLRDGRFGPIDVFQWPQLYSEKFPYSSCIPRREAWVNDAGISALWWNPSPSDFAEETGSKYAIGRLTVAARQKFEWLHLVLMTKLEDMDSELKKYPAFKHSMSARQFGYALDRLKNYPLTFRELVLQVAEYQRIGLDIFAYCEYALAMKKRSSDVNTFLMGVFSGNPQTCQHCFSFGIPVWFIRPRHELRHDTNIATVLSDFTLPTDIVTDPPIHSGIIAPFPVLYIGRSCDNRQMYNRQLSRTEFDIYKPGNPVCEAFYRMTRPEDEHRMQAANSVTGSRGPFSLSLAPSTSDPHAASDTVGRVSKTKSRNRISPCMSVCFRPISLLI